MVGYQESSRQGERGFSMTLNAVPPMAVSHVVSGTLPDKYELKSRFDRFPVDKPSNCR